MIAPRLAAFCSLLGLAAALPAQLAGTYTVGAGGTYADIAAAIAALTTQGVSAPVNFRVLSNDTGPWTIGAFPGQGPANPVTFEPLTGPVTLAGAQPILTLSGCDSVTFRGFRGSFTATPNAFVINAGTANTTFAQCEFLAPTATSGQALINVLGGSNLRITESNFGGAYESIYVQIGATNTTIERCRILGGGFWIMRLAGPDTTLVNNFITGPSNYGISAGISGNAASGANLKIWHNTVYIVHPTFGTQYCSLRWYSNNPGTEVVNNIFVDNYGAQGALNMWCLGALRPARMDYNCFWSNIPGYNPVFAGANLQLPAWQALGFDTNSISADPLFVAPGANPANLDLQPQSPCESAGTLLPAVPADYYGLLRTAPVSIGAHELNAGSTAFYLPFGAGCAGTAGVPSNTSSGAPVLGTSMTLTFGNLPAPELAVAIFGLSGSMSGFGPLPLDLAVFGAPGCFGRVSPDATAFLLGSSGAATLVVNTPNLPGLLGVVYYTQALVLDPTLNALGVSMSDAAGAGVGL
jgi:hypothetical protein